MGLGDYGEFEYPESQFVADALGMRPSGAKAVNHFAGLRHGGRRALSKASCVDSR